MNIQNFEAGGDVREDYSSWVKPPARVVTPTPTPTPAPAPAPASSAPAGYYWDSSEDAEGRTITQLRPIPPPAPVRAPTINPETVRAQIAASLGVPVSSVEPQYRRVSLGQGEGVDETLTGYAVKHSDSEGSLYGLAGERTGGYTPKIAKNEGFFGAISGALADLDSSLGLSKNAPAIVGLAASYFLPGVGQALGQSLVNAGVLTGAAATPAAATAIGTALAQTGVSVAQGQPLDKALTGAIISGGVSGLTQAFGADVKEAIAKVADNPVAQKAIFKAGTDVVTAVAQGKTGDEVLQGIGKSIVSTVAGAAANEAVKNIPGIENLSPAQQNIVKSGIATSIQGGDGTKSMLNTALKEGTNYVLDAVTSSPTVLGTAGTTAAMQGGFGSEVASTAPSITDILAGAGLSEPNLPAEDVASLLGTTSFETLKNQIRDANATPEEKAILLSALESEPTAQALPAIKTDAGPNIGARYGSPFAANDPRIAPILAKNPQLVKSIGEYTNTYGYTTAAQDSGYLQNLIDAAKDSTPAGQKIFKGEIATILARNPSLRPLVPSTLLAGQPLAELESIAVESQPVANVLTDAVIRDFLSGKQTSLGSGYEHNDSNAPISNLKSSVANLTADEIEKIITGGQTSLGLSPTNQEILDAIGYIPERVPAPEVAPAPAPEVVPEIAPSVAPAVQPMVQPTIEPTPEVVPTPVTAPEVIPIVETTPTPNIVDDLLKSGLIEAPMPSPETQPVVAPIVVPAVKPSVAPEVQPAVQPFAEPAIQPIVRPAVEPTINPATQPTVEPAVSPAVQPIAEPVVTPATAPTIAPTITPEVTPEVTPTVTPSVTPEVIPVVSPTVPPPTLPSIVVSTDPANNTALVVDKDGIATVVDNPNNTLVVGDPVPPITPTVTPPVTPPVVTPPVIPPVVPPVVPPVTPPTITVPKTDNRQLRDQLLMGLQGMLLGSQQQVTPVPVETVQAGPAFDISSPLNVGFFGEYASQKVPAKDKESLKIATGGYLDDLLEAIR